MFYIQNEVRKLKLANSQNNMTKVMVLSRVLGNKKDQTPDGVANALNLAAFILQKWNPSLFISWELADQEKPLLVNYYLQK